MSQGSGKPFTETWRPDGSIWANKFPSTFPTQREATGSRGNMEPLSLLVPGIMAKYEVIGSDEVSPTAPSGSAQLNHQSEAEPRVPSSGPRGGFWNNQDAASGNTSPSISRDNMVDSQYFGSRSAVGQNGTSLSGLSKSQTRLNPSSVPFNNSPMFGGDLDSMQFPPQTKYSFDQSAASFHRGSQDQGFANPRLGRESVGILNSRSSDLGQQASGAVPQYSFDASIANNAALNSNRPTMTHQSISYPLNGVSQRGRGGADQDMANLLKNSLSLEDPYEADPHAYGNPGLPMNPGSQPWSQEYENTGRAFAPGYQQDSFVDQVPGAYYGSKRGSVDRNSPASVHRTGFNSPRFAPGPNPRSDAYLSRPGSSRNSVLGQDLDRPQGSSQYVTQNPQFYPTNQYYSPNVTPQYPQATHYDIYGQNAGYRNPMSMPSYGMPMNSYLPGMNAPVRSSRDTDPGRGVRSQTLEEFRANNKSSKRYDLKVRLVKSLLIGGMRLTVYTRTFMSTLLNSAEISTGHVSSRKSYRRRTAMRRTKFSGKSRPMRFS